MPVDAAKLKQNAADIKTAIKKALTKDKAGNTKWVGFAFMPGKDAKGHVFMMHKMKKGPALNKLILKDNTGAKTCWGMGTVGKAGGKPTVWIEYQKRLPGAEKKMTEALRLMHIPFQVKVRADEKGADVPAAPAAADENEDENAEDQDQDQGDQDDAGADDAFNDMMAAGNQADDGGDGGADEGQDEAENEDEDEDRQQGDGADDAEDEGEEEEQPAVAAAPAGDPKHKQGAQVWDKTRTVLHGSIDKFKQAVRAEYQDEHPDLLSEIDKGLGQVDKIMSTLDQRLSTALNSAHSATDDRSRTAALGDAKKALADYLKYVQSEPLIGHLDNNPFGVPMNLKAVLVKSLTGLAGTIKA